MKTRSGFISNSSSSSFIIAVPRDIKTVGTLQDYIFHKEKTVYSDYGESYAVSDVAHRVFEDMLKEGRKTQEELVEEYCHGWTPEYEKANRQVEAEMNALDFHDKDNYHTAWKKINDKRDRFLRKLVIPMIDKFVRKNPNCDFYCLSYGDDNGHFEAAIEHGDTFHNIPHLVVSHH